MIKVINVLIFEEDQANFELFKHQCLSWAPNCVITRANSRKKLEVRLKWMNYNLILVGFGQPSFAAIDFLFYLRDVHSHSPVVFVLDPEREYNGADTAIMKHGAAALYHHEFQEKSFLLEEVLHQSMPKFNVQLAEDRHLLEQAIQKGWSKHQGEEKSDAKMNADDNILPPGFFAQELPSVSRQQEGDGRPEGSQDSDSEGGRGQDPYHKSSSTVG